MEELKKAKCDKEKVLKVKLDYLKRAQAAHQVCVRVQFSFCFAIANDLGLCSLYIWRLWKVFAEAYSAET